MTSWHHGPVSTSRTPTRPPPFLSAPFKHGRPATPKKLKKIATRLPDGHLLRLGEAKLHKPFADSRLGLHQAWLFGRVADPSRKLLLSMPTPDKSRATAVVQAGAKNDAVCTRDPYVRTNIEVACVFPELRARKNEVSSWLTGGIS